MWSVTSKFVAQIISQQVELGYHRQCKVLFKMWLFCISLSSSSEKGWAYSSSFPHQACSILFGIFSFPSSRIPLAPWTCSTEQGLRLALRTTQGGRGRSFGTYAEGCGGTRFRVAVWLIAPILVVVYDTHALFVAW